MKREKGFIEGYLGMKVPYTVLKQDNSLSKLALFFPGMGYTTQAPVLYYPTSLLASKGYDILHINYEYDKSPFTDYQEEERLECIRENVNAVCEWISSNLHYEELVVIGKSIGTVSMAYLSDYLVPAQTKLVWLTPLLNKEIVYDRMRECQQKSYAAIGTADPCYIEDKWNEITKSIYFETLLLERVDHSLDSLDDPMQSIENVSLITKQIFEFIKG